MPSSETNSFQSNAWSAVLTLPKSTPETWLTSLIYVQRKSLLCGNHSKKNRRDYQVGNGIITSLPDIHARGNCAETKIILWKHHYMIHVFVLR
mmetsp:Transcript_13365/g.19463  ORF Transcript_13365/g.19463 Transcript_13365/m.19463 type:complete len:93 (+) Transcript_13365:53-331(+)